MKKNKTIVRLKAAGSLRTVLGSVVHFFNGQNGIDIDLELGPSGVLREQIETHGQTDIFISADLAHAQTLYRSGKAVKPVFYTENQLCLFGNFHLKGHEKDIIHLLMDPGKRLGTSTPGDDPGGDYAFSVFEKLNALRPGIYQQLSQKSLQLVGGRSSRPTPEGKHPVLHLFESGQIDFFLGYYTSALAVQKQMAKIEIMMLPKPIRTRAEYYLVRMKDSSPETSVVIDFLFSERGRQILDASGFSMESGSP